MVENVVRLLENAGAVEIVVGTCVLITVGAEGRDGGMVTGGATAITLLVLAVLDNGVMLPNDVRGTGVALVPVRNENDCVGVALVVVVVVGVATFVAITLLVFTVGNVDNRYNAKKVFV